MINNGLRDNENNKLKNWYHKREYLTVAISKYLNMIGRAILSMPLFNDHIKTTLLKGTHINGPQLKWQYLTVENSSKLNYPTNTIQKGAAPNFHGCIKQH